VKVRNNFLAQIALVFALAALLLGVPLSILSSREVIVAVVSGALISTANVILGYAAIRYSLDKSYTTFLKAVVGGMGLRLFIMLGMLAALILVFHLDALALVVSALGFHAVYLILEVLFIQRTATLKGSGVPT